MGYIIVFLTGLVLGYMLAVRGNIETMKNKTMFYKKDDGSWYPHNLSIENSQQRCPDCSWIEGHATYCPKYEWPSINKY